MTIYKGATNFIGLHNNTALKLNEKQKELYKAQSVEKIYPEYYLIKVRDFNDNSKDTLDEWINFLKNETIAQNPKSKGLKRAKEELDYMKMKEQGQQNYNRYKKEKHHEASVYESTYVIGKIEGKIVGEKIGAKKERVIANEKLLEIVESLKNNNMDKDAIKAITGLSDNELEN